VAVLNLAGSGPLTGVASISAGFQDACAVTNAGALLCWGANQAGEDGNNTNTSVNSPAQVLNLAGTGPLGGITAVSTGDNDTCAITSAGGVLCWGDAFNGELGDGAGRPSSEIPVQVTGLTSGVTAIASGYHHNCAVLSSGGVMCWGFDINGQIGNGNTNDVFTPVAVVGVGGAEVLKLF
jgi:alpha-tubulin suppressor-like RCC1 family protein